MPVVNIMSVTTNSTVSISVIVILFLANTRIVIIRPTALSITTFATIIVGMNIIALIVSILVLLMRLCFRSCPQ